MATSDKLAFAALGISVFTFIFSWYSFSKTDELSKSAFTRNYRPYVTASNFSYLQNNNLIPLMNVIMIKIFNAPALVTSKKLTFYRRQNNADTVLFEHPEYKSELLYPLENVQYTIVTDTNTISHAIAVGQAPSELIRKIRIEYQWISDSSLHYFFESEWKYNAQNHDWDIITQKAN